MELLIAILMALNVCFTPGTSVEDFTAAHQSDVDRAKMIMETNAFTVEPTTGNIIIIDETGN